MIHAPTMEEHDRRLRAVLPQVRETGLKLDRKKASYARNEVEYFGLYITENGHRPHPDKIDDLPAIKPPKNVSQLRATMGTFNYHTKFYPQLADKFRPNSALLSEKNGFL